MILSVSNNGFEWSLHFGPNSVNLIVKDLIQKKQEILKNPFWQLEASCCLKDKTFWTTI